MDEVFGKYPKKYFLLVVLGVTLLIIGLLILCVYCVFYKNAKRVNTIKPDISAPTETITIE